MKVLVSAGPTRESIDPVRFISNRSSGKMGFSLAEAALTLGHETTLVTGPVHLDAPAKAELVPVVTAADMEREMLRYAEEADLIIMAAAVADFRPARVLDRKLKRKGRRMRLELVPTNDILMELGKNKRPGQILVGFAAETENLVKNAKKKMCEKNLDWIIVNDVSRQDIGFESDNNSVFMLAPGKKPVKLSLEKKRVLAGQILARILSEPV